MEISNRVMEGELGNALNRLDDAQSNDDDVLYSISIKRINLLLAQSSVLKFRREVTADYIKEYRALLSPENLAFYFPN